MRIFRRRWPACWRPRSAARCSPRAPIPRLAAGSSISRNRSTAPALRPKSATTKIEAVGAGTKVIVDNVQADGSIGHWEFTANYDGKDSPMIGNNPNADMVARTRINARTVQTISKKGGKVTTTQTSEVSADGKTRTVITKGVNAAGQTVHNVAVYDRQ